VVNSRRLTGFVPDGGVAGNATAHASSIPPTASALAWAAVPPETGRRKITLLIAHPGPPDPTTWPLTSQAGLALVFSAPTSMQRTVERGIVSFRCTVIRALCEQDLHDTGYPDGVPDVVRRRRGPLSDPKTKRTVGSDAGR
jgi:hypothetical protein